MAAAGASCCGKAHCGAPLMFVSATCCVCDSEIGRDGCCSCKLLQEGALQGPPDVRSRNLLRLRQRNRARWLLQQQVVAGRRIAGSRSTVGDPVSSADRCNRTRISDKTAFVDLWVWSRRAPLGGGRCRLKSLPSPGGVWVYTPPAPMRGRAERHEAAVVDAGCAVSVLSAPAAHRPPGECDAALR